MADLFARLGARSRGQITAVQPRPDAIYTGRSVVAGAAAPPDNPLGDLWAASVTDAQISSAGADAPHIAAANQSQSTGYAVRPSHPTPLLLPNPSPVGGVENRSSPTEFDRHDGNAAAFDALSAQRIAPTSPMLGQASVAQVVVALDAGSPAEPYDDATPPPGLAPPPADATGRQSEPAGAARRGRNDPDVHVTIGELVIRGAPGSAGPSQPAPPPAAPPALTLRDYLRGQREPA
jgi:hypothetical protein